jgi:hypothetical protein
MDKLLTATITKQGGFMQNTSLEITRIRPVFPDSAVMSSEVPPLLEDLMDVDDISGYVRHMFSRKEPMLTREEQEICDMATD